MFELALLYSLEGDIDRATDYFQILIDKNTPNKNIALQELENIKSYKKQIKK